MEAWLCSGLVFGCLGRLLGCLKLIAVLGLSWSSPSEHLGPY